MSALAQQRSNRAYGQQPAPHLELIWSQPDVERLPAAVYRRRRVVGLVLAAIFCLGAWSAITSGVSWGRQQLGVPAVPAIPAQPSTWTVQEGDTLWHIAQATHAGSGDVRPVVQRLSDARDGKPLQVGETITIPPPG